MWAVLLSVEALVEAPVIWLPLLVEALLSVSSSVLLSVSVWLVLVETMWAVLLSSAPVVKAPVIWLPMVLEEERSASSSMLPLLWV